MARLKFLRAAALLAAAVTTPAFAQPVIQEPGAAAQNRPWVNDYDRYDAHQRWSGEVAAGAVDTAGAIATAPFRGRDSYAYDRGPSYGRRHDNADAHYGERPVRGRTTCGVQPGATFMGPDGQWYPC
jgi:hypothetical protein